MTSHTTLYRLFDADGELLYVGIAGNPGRRFAQHGGEKPWWREVSETTLTHYDTRAEALMAEREAIQTEHPRYNIMLSLRAPSPSADDLRLEAEEEADILGHFLGRRMLDVGLSKNAARIAAEMARRVDWPDTAKAVLVEAAVYGWEAEDDNELMGEWMDPYEIWATSQARYLLEYPETFQCGFAGITVTEPPGGA